MGSRAIRVLVRAQEIVSARGPYRYVEIGSYLGRTLQPHLQDPDCTAVLSIDLRPEVTADERGDLDVYKDVTADDMIARLAQVCTPAEMAKLTALTAGSEVLAERPGDGLYDLALIDGAHTIEAAFDDFMNLLPAMSPDGLILFDDTSIVLPGIKNAMALLRARDIRHFAVFGRGGVTVLGLGRGAAAVEAGFDGDLTITPAQAQTRYRERTISGHITQNMARHLRHNPGLRRRAARILRQKGYGVRPPGDDQAAE